MDDNQNAVFEVVPQRFAGEGMDRERRAAGRVGVREVGAPPALLAYWVVACAAGLTARAERSR